MDNKEFRLRKVRDLLEVMSDMELALLLVFVVGMQRGRKTAQTSAADAKEKKPRTCSKCRKPGHRAKNCLD